MKKYLLLFFILILVLTVQCSSSFTFIEQNIKEYPVKQEYPAKYDTVWDAAEKSLDDYHIKKSAKVAGLIETDWLEKTVQQEISVRKGWIFKRHVTENMPVEVRERLTVIVTPLEYDNASVNIVRYVMIRPYVKSWRTAWQWSPDTDGTFAEAPSDTNTEHWILHEILKIVDRTGKDNKKK
ncbi:MAG: hypothetical protein JXB48_03965 [Candidatus Latescibacteria bacterium]|nr:hypothetical protein [Candidatus Latescibacterota bacterium]